MKEKDDDAARVVIVETSHVLGAVPIQPLKLTLSWGCSKPVQDTANNVWSDVKSISSIS